MTTVRRPFFSHPWCLDPSKIMLSVSESSADLLTIKFEPASVKYIYTIIAVRTGGCVLLSFRRLIVRVLSRTFFEMSDGQRDNT